MGGFDGKFPYPKEVWSPAGGWWAKPKAWRSNSLVVGLGIIAICTPIFIVSERYMERLGDGNGHKIPWRPGYKPIPIE